MPRHYRKTILGLGPLAWSSPSRHPRFPPSPLLLVTGARIVAHFDIAALQQPENITLDPTGMQM